MSAIRPWREIGLARTVPKTQIGCGFRYGPRFAVTQGCRKLVVHDTLSKIGTKGTLSRHLRYGKKEERVVVAIAKER